MELVTISRMNAFRRCPRLHYLMYELKRRPIRTGEAMSFGTIFHSALESWWRWFLENGGAKVERDTSNALADAIDAARRSFESVGADAELDPFDLIKAEELMLGYHCRWAASMADLSVLAVEMQFETALVNPLTKQASRTYRLGGKLDALVLVRSLGERRVVEHKTTTADITPGAAYWKRLQMDGQISTYLEGAAAHGAEARGCLYDVAKRPQIRPYLATPEEERKYTEKPSKLRDGTIRPAGSLYANQRERDESPEEFRLRLRGLISEDPNAFYQRGDVVRLEDDMNEFRFDTWETAKTLRERQLAGRELGALAWPRSPHSCERNQRFCDYYAACTKAASIDDDSIFRTSEQHAELAAPPAAE